MVRSLLVLALVSAQLQSWSGTALYLCLNGDGAVCCIDDGPESCDCCHHEDEPQNRCCAESPTPCRDHPHEEEHQSPASDDSAWLSALPCDCTHVLIAQQQAPVILRTPSTNDVERSSQALAPATGVPVTVEWEGLRADQAGRFRPPGTPALSLRTQSSVVLRC